MSTAQDFDYIIVGAGSAGCVLANRLTEDRDTRVLVLEAGPQDHSIFIHMPSAFAYPLAGRKYNWWYESEPEPFLDNRKMYCPARPRHWWFVVDQRHDLHSRARLRL